MAESTGGRLLARAAYLFTFLTGAAGLADQLVWQRYLARIVGSDSLATATVLGVFLGGLSLGCFLCGRLAGRLLRPLSTYGLFEGAIGLWALAFPALFSVVDTLTASWAFEAPVGLVLQGALCAVALIGPPTLCMGATVPLLTQALTASLARAPGVNARVYGWNTLGALFGTLGTGFFAMRLLGLPGTLRLAGSLNLAAALYFVLASRRALPRPVEARAERAEALPGRVPGRVALHAIVLLGGFAFMTLEILIVRVAGLALGSSTYTFTLVIAAFLSCIAAGALLAAGVRRPPRTLLFWSQLVACLALLPAFLTLDDWPWAAYALRIRLGSSLQDFVSYQLGAFGALTLVLAVPVAAMGATLPLAFAALASRLSGVGRTAGTLFAWNALGNLLGGLVGGYVAFRLLDIGEIFLLVVGLVAVTTLFAASGLGVREKTLAALAAAGVAVFAGLSPSHDPLRFAVGTFNLREPLGEAGEGPASFYHRFYEGRTVLAYRDDPEATVAAVENPRLVDALKSRFPSLGRAIVAVPSALDAEGPRPRSILINGKADSSTFYDRETLRLSAHLPALLSERLERALVVGLGTGVTAGELARYDELEVLDVVEIAPGVVDLLPQFSDWTGRVQDDPRLRILVGDAFRVLRRTDERFDLVISQPSNPWTSGVDQLFSREYFRLVRAHLEPEGLFLSWLQRYATNDTISALSLGALRAEFPYVRAFRSGSDELLLASLAPLGPEALARAEERLEAHPAVRASLAEIRVTSAADLLALEDPGLIERTAALAELGYETLDRPRVHFLAGIAFFRAEDPEAPLR